MTVLGLFLNAEIRSGGHKRYLELLEGLASHGVRTIAFFNAGQRFRPTGVEAIELAPAHQPFIPISIAFSSAVRSGLALLPSGVRVDWIVVFGETHLAAAIALKKRLGAPILYSHRSNAVREGFAALAENRWNPFKLFRVCIDLVKSRHYERVIARNADIVVFQSPYDRDDFLSRERTATDRSIVIRGNIGEPRFKAKYENTNRSDRLRRILFIGTFGERKGIKYFIQAAALLAARGRVDLTYDLVGYGVRRPFFEGLVRKAGMADHMQFHGRLADPFPPIAKADLLVVPSLFDSYPNTVLEALHAGTPVIASATGGIPDILRHEELLFPIRDAAAIADRIERCIIEPEFYARIKALCTERKVDFLFDWTEAFIMAMQRSDNYERE